VFEFNVIIAHVSTRLQALCRSLDEIHDTIYDSRREMLRNTDIMIGYMSRRDSYKTCVSRRDSYKSPWFFHYSTISIEKRQGPGEFWATAGLDKLRVLWYAG